MRRILIGVLVLGALSLAHWAGADDAKKDDNKAAPAASETKRRPSDVVFLLIETTAVDDESIVELQRLYDVLRKLDKNNNGKIDHAEVKNARAQLIEDRIDHIMKKLDSNGDGEISKAEAKGRILENFEFIDTNGDGFITRDELRSAIEARPKKSSK
jgi:Ca2+-binding EF-hand superfamily protein